VAVDVNASAVIGVVVEGLHDVICADVGDEGRVVDPLVDPICPALSPTMRYWVVPTVPAARAVIP
jgi:hypothetical protein